MTPTSTPPVSREQIAALQAALDCMNYLGDILNDMDAVTPEDEAFTAPIFTQVRAALGHAPPAVDAGRAAPPSPVTEGETGTPITLRYTNWRGETADRTILPIRVIYGTNEWHKEPCYMIEAVDLEKGDVRTFALAGIGGTADADRQIAALQQRIAALEEGLRPFARHAEIDWVIRQEDDDRLFFAVNGNDALSVLTAGHFRRAASLLSPHQSTAPDGGSDAI